MNFRETIKEADYIHIGMLGQREHVLFNKKTNMSEVWVASPHHAGYALKYKNTELEYITGYKESVHGWIDARE